MRISVLLAIAGTIALAAPAAQAQTPVEDHQRAMREWRVSVRDHIAVTADWEKFSGKTMPNEQIRAGCAIIGPQRVGAASVASALMIATDPRYGAYGAVAAANVMADSIVERKVAMRCQAARNAR